MWNDLKTKLDAWETRKGRTPAWRGRQLYDGQTDWLAESQSVESNSSYSVKSEDVRGDVQSQRTSVEI
jgi:hypothetical protein